MAKFHSVNKTMTLGTFLFIASLIVLVIGAIFHSNQTILAYTFLYGGIAFLVSLVLLAVGAILEPFLTLIDNVIPITKNITSSIGSSN